MNLFRIPRFLKSKKTIHTTPVSKSIWNDFFEYYNIDGSNKYYKPFKAVCSQFDIENQLAFLAQICHESYFFRRRKENLNFSAKALIALFNKYYKGNHELAERDAYKPRKIYDRCYIRYGNKKGDNPMFIGRGAIQLTFRKNYENFQKDVLKYEGYDCVKNPDILLEDDFFLLPAGWYWLKKGCDDARDFKKITKIINGGYNGLQHRTELYLKLISFSQ